jgi:hypothetical protein
MDRREFALGLSKLGTFGITASLISTTATAAVNSEEPLGPNVITVGLGGIVEEINDLASVLVNASETNKIAVTLLPGTHTLTQPLYLPPYVYLNGVDKSACTLVGEGNANIRYNNETSISNITYNYTGDGNRSAAIRNAGNIGTSDTGSLNIDNVFIKVVDSKRSGIWLQGINTVSIRNCDIVTSGIGIELVNALSVQIIGTNIILSDTDTNNSHIGIYKCDASRVWVRDAMIATAYAFAEPLTGGISNEGDQKIIGVWCDNNAGGRVELFDTWSILRSSSGVTSYGMVCNILNTSARGWFRIYDGYYQAEAIFFNDSVAELINDALPTTNGGRIEIMGNTRYKLSRGTIFSQGPGLGVEYVFSSTSWLNAVGSGGLKIVSADTGDIDCTLPAVPTIGEEYIFKRTDTSINIVRIISQNSTIEEDSVVIIPPIPYATLHIRYGGDSVWYRV